MDLTKAVIIDKIKGRQWKNQYDINLLFVTYHQSGIYNQFERIDFRMIDTEGNRY